MRQLAAFTKKEFMEIIRTGKVYILLILFVIFGIMSPAIAKLTPWMYDMLADSMKDQGITIGKTVVTALTSWQQYYKNMSMEFIAFVVMFCGVLTLEYQKGTLINMLTKGLPRWKVIVSKYLAVLISWSICYLLCFGITYGYNAYFWDNSTAKHCVFAAFTSYLFGLWLISLIMLFSSLLNTSTAVLLATGLMYAVVLLLGMIPKLVDLLPTKLTRGVELLAGATKIQDYTLAIVVTIVLIVISGIVTIIHFNHKRI
ncbi:ABC transporter permease [Anaeromicropila herbilytica]|uniref:ABC transporter permease n=1 Tax=Anaeromicropila herbilytica TaxID=2785025 RepID=A0A7R7ELG5_9FIRM|nr:ABC transporter permease subunit [Anaeromicropila herbilytica]BCN30781.1 ABC transporter permease [Anaeromicropila herbilytica]